MADDATKTVADSVEPPVETDVKTKSNGEDSSLPPKVISGLSRQLDKYKSGIEVKSPDNGKDNGKANTDDKPVTYDYSFLKDLKDEDYKKYEHIKDEGVRHQMLTLLNDMKKNQRLVAERERTINDLKNTKPEERYAKMEEFIAGMKQDAIGTYKRFQKDFELPDVDFLEKQVSTGGDIQSRLEQWQESDLVPKIEKKFKIETGTFVYDPSEAYKAGTASYEFRVQTEKQEKAWLSEYESSINKQQEILAKVKQQNDADILFVRDTYFPESDYESKEKAEEAFVQALNALDEIQSKNRQGEFDPLANPFAFRNIFRGVMFDQLVEKAVKKAVTDIHSQYNAKGLYLPDRDSSPTDATKVKGTPPPPPDDKRRKFSPMQRSVNRSLQS